MNFSILLFLTTFLFPWLSVQATQPSTDMTQDSIKVIYIKGIVTFSQDGKSFQQLSRDLSLTLGQFIKTQKDSFVILSLNESSKIKIHENSLFHIQSLPSEINSQDLKKVHFLLEWGEILIDFVNKVPQLQLQVETPLFSTSIRGTKFFLSTQFPPGGVLAVQHGLVSLTSKKTLQTVLVGKEEGVSVDGKTGEVGEVGKYPWYEKINWNLENADSPILESESKKYAEKAQIDQKEEGPNTLESLFEKACHNKNADACTFLSTHRANETLIENLKQSCRDGSPYGCFLLGQTYQASKEKTHLKDAQYLNILAGQEHGQKEQNLDKFILPQDLREGCLQKKKYSCVQWGYQSKDLGPSQKQEVEKVTGYREALFKVLIRECGMNNILACDTLSQLTSSQGANEGGEAPKK